jgi:hypothetical protein
MIRLSSNLIFGMFFLIMCSCASSYKQINPDSLYFTGKSGQDDIEFSYKTSILNTSGNSKFALKEAKSGTSLIAVRILNNSEKEIIIGQNAHLKSGNYQLELLTPNQITSKIKQSTASYLLFMLLTPMHLTIDDRDGPPESYNIGIGVGPGLTLLNMATASGANSAFYNELVQFSLINKSIAPGETTFGLVGFNHHSFGTIELEIFD